MESPAKLLATVADLVARLGRPLTSDEQARAAALLADASALVRSHTGRTFAAPPVTETRTLRAQGGEIRLPSPPIRDVDRVALVLGLDGVGDVPVVGWRWDGADLLHVSADTYVINQPEILRDVEIAPWTYRVTYTHGHDQVPDDVVAVVAAMVLRCLTAPSSAGGVVSETIGGYSYRLADGASGTAVILTGADRAALAGYRRRTGVTMTRL
ncbi:hypothetical protein SMC26_40320 [Actinomadura fulvescens]|uniref:Uncharacterized protein n=1 Tax=Actinomadura fulvescens TaxID=46160 RepID=A0ABP6CJA2_9ACTN